MTAFHLYGFNIYNDEDADRVYCLYSNMNKSVISRFVLSFEGKIERSYWDNMALGWDVVWLQPNTECQLYGRCGPNGVCNHKGSPICSCLPGFGPLQPADWYSGNWSGGCVRNNPLQCQESKFGSKNGFSKLTNMKLPDNSVTVGGIEQTRDCEEKCNSNCSCVAYSYESGLGCLTWEGDMNDLQTFAKDDGLVLYIHLDKSDLQGRKKESFTWLLVLVILALVALILYAFLTVRRMTRSHRTSSLRHEKDKLHFSMYIEKNSNRHYLDAKELEEGGNQVKGSDLPIFGGYMAPEYAMEGLFSVKSDVFSFGVLLLEIVSGKRNAGFIDPDKQLNLLGYAWELWRENMILDLADPSLGNLYSRDEIARCIQVGLLCVQDNAADRPNMDSVVFMLGSEATALPSPIKPSFSIARTPRETDTYALGSELHFSANAISFSMEYGR
ncbi:Receptor-like serine/threonine-protein kinase SD1-7 [Thalictrum thalictroides]|uniref:non-specific serine/threonine protein kinase n=1 Tax=Thalictrum thalictroides TaxID=46969 RepID=A0A7J6WU41_THATH|nr:Receptor-like serine/threonine-protein kinase SD1-7 [Thalictrum thalictroides]